MEIRRYYNPINRILLLLFFCFQLSGQTLAQIEFKDKKFGVELIDSIHYATARNFGGANVKLHMDIYLPDSLDDYERPLIVFAHGGSFLTGNRKSQDLIILCNQLVERGYICASIDYRKGINVLRDFKEELAKATWRVMQDERTAIRYFRDSYAKGNPYHIDTSQMYLAGVSAGSIAALHAAFQTDTSEIPATISVGSVGGLFAGDHENYSSAFKGVINLFGAISDTTYIDFPPDIQQCHLHGSSDQTVPYKTDIYAPNNIEIGLLHGSYVIDSISRSMGMTSTLKTLWNKGHVPYTRDSIYIDTTLNFIVDCMFDKVNLGKKVGIEEITEGTEQLKIRQSRESLKLENTGSSLAKIKIINYQGQIIFEARVLPGKEVILNTTNLQGPHILQFASGDLTFRRKIWLF